MMKLTFLVLASIGSFLGHTSTAQVRPRLSDGDDAGDPIQRAWSAFKSDFAKNYTSNSEDQRRRLIFEDSLKIVQSHNYLYETGRSTYEMGINHFSDMEFSEIRQMMGFLENGAVLPPSPRRGDDWDTDDTEDDFSRFSDSCIYDPVDWRDYGYVTRVKNQRDCGSSWAFSATGSLEGQMKRRTGRPVSLSEQNLIDCSWAQGNRGCDGGSMRKAFDYIKSNGGISVEKCYSYDAKNGTCRYNPRCSGGTVRGYVSIKKGSERALTKAISHIGPISVGIRVPESFHRYKSGVYEDSSCNNASDHHAVLAVGYGITRGEAYYTLKNSWGVHWGEHGYIYMARNQRNMCGIADAAVYPIV